jgi:hypothetical protein
MPEMGSSNKKVRELGALSSSNFPGSVLWERLYPSKGTASSEPDVIIE